MNPLRQNQFGISGGGPVWLPKIYNGKNRTFFYGGWESFRQSQAAQNIGLTPTQQQLAGDFSETSNQLYNPFSVTPDPNRPGSYMATPFAGNQIPTALLDPAAELYAKTLLPAPVNTGVPGTNEIDNTPSRVHQESYQGRVDQYFGERDQLFGRISYYDQNNSSSGGFPGAVNHVIISGWNGVIHETHTFGPTAVLDAYFGRNWGDDLTGVVLTNAPSGFVKQLEQVGFSSNFIENFRGGYGPFIPSMGISGYVSAGENVQDTRIADIWQGGGDFTKILGRHTLKVGGHLATNNTVSPIFNANVSFSSTQTQNPENANGTGNALASYLLGVPDSASKRNVLETVHGGWVDGGYIQDQWKVNDRLTLNIGFRYDVTLFPIYGTPGTPDSYVGDYNLNNGTYIITALPDACSPTVGFPCIPGGTLPDHVVVTPQSNQAILHNDYGDWQGRFGLAYRVGKSTAIRAGYGRFYDNWNSVIQLAQNYEGNWPDVGQLIANNLNHPGGTSASIGDPFNLGSGGVVYPAPTPFNQVNWFVDPTDYKMPYSDQWNFGIQQQLGHNTVLSLAYVGAHDLQLNSGGYRNTAVTPGPGDAAVVASRRPYPYITPTYYDRSVGQSSYNSFQFRLQQATSTRSKSIDVGCSGSFGAEGCSVTDPYNLNLDRSVSGFDVPNNFSTSFVYQVPVGHGRSFSTGNNTLDYILGNWDVSGVLNIYSGIPFNVNAANGDISNTGNVSERADLVMANPYPANRTPAEWINPAAFATPAPYTFGTLGRNALRSDSTENLDLSIIRRFPFKERYTVEFRADSFNLTNTPIFSPPHATLDNPNFGVITSTRNSPRELQFALKFLF